MGGTSDPVEMCGYFMYQIHLGGTSDPLGGDIRSTNTPQRRRKLGDSAS